MSANPLELVETEHPITGEVQPNEFELSVRREIEQRRERIEREAKCNQALQKVLDDHSCNLAVFFDGGQGNLVPISHLVVPPVIFKSVSR